jgi:hypothetical protein
MQLQVTKKSKNLYISSNLIFIYRIKIIKKGGSEDIYMYKSEKDKIIMATDDNRQRQKSEGVKIKGSKKGR